MAKAFPCSFKSKEELTDEDDWAGIAEHEDPGLLVLTQAGRSSDKYLKFT